MGKMIDRMWERLRIMFDREGFERDRELQELIRIEREQLEVQKEILHELQHEDRYNVVVSQLNHKGDFQMANNIPTGGQGTFNAVLQDNGVPVATQPSGWTWGTNDPSAVVTPVTTDPTGATVTVAIPASDTSTSIVITASNKDPNGNPVSGSLTVPVAAGGTFTVVVTQIA